MEAPESRSIRFADDFLVFTPSRKDAGNAKEVAAKGLEKLGLTLHPEKTRIVISSPKVVFLGRRLPAREKNKK